MRREGADIFSEAVTFLREAVTFLREAVTFSREAVKFFSKAVKFSREAVTFFGRDSHQPRQNSFYDLSHHACKYIIVITVNEPSPLAPLTPALGAGGVGGVGCFLLVPIIIRARAAAGATAAWLSHRRAGTYTDGTPVGASPWGSKHTGQPRVRFVSSFLGTKGSWGQVV